MRDRGEVGLGILVATTSRSWWWYTSRAVVDFVSRRGQLFGTTSSITRLSNDAEQARRDCEMLAHGWHTCAGLGSAVSAVIRYHFVGNFA